MLGTIGTARLNAGRHRYTYSRCVKKLYPISRNINSVFASYDVKELFPSSLIVPTHCHKLTHRCFCSHADRHLALSILLRLRIDLNKSRGLLWDRHWTEKFRFCFHELTLIWLRNTKVKNLTPFAYFPNLLKSCQIIVRNLYI